MEGTSSRDEELSTLVRCCSSLPLCLSYCEYCRLVFLRLERRVFLRAAAAQADIRVGFPYWPRLPPVRLSTPTSRCAQAFTVSRVSQAGCRACACIFGSVSVRGRLGAVTALLI